MKSWRWGKSGRLVLVAPVVVALGGLSACDIVYFPWQQEKVPTTLPTTTKEIGKESSAAAPKASSAVKSQSPEGTQKPKAKQTPSKQIEVELPREAAPSRHPNDLIGRDEAAVNSMIGAPASTRNDGSAMIWSYRTVGCSLEIFFFLDVQSNTRRVLSYDLKAEAADADAPDLCYAQFRGV